MKRALAFLALLLPATAMAQSTVSVRLYWLQEVREAQISGQQGELRFRTCATCAPQSPASSLLVRAAQGSLEVNRKPGEGDLLEILSSTSIEIAGHPRVDVPGGLQIRREGDRLTLTLRLGLEEYVAGVLAGESSSFHSAEALKAMSVAVRTYAAHYRGRHRAEGFDFCDTTHCQDLRLGNISERLRAATSNTEGELLWYEGRPAATYYHRDCSGTTEAVQHAWPAQAAPYLRQLSDAYCTARGRSEWHSQVTKAELRQALILANLTVPPDWRGIEVASRTPSGRVARLRLTGATSQTVPADAFRLAVGRAIGWERLRSDQYDVQLSGERFVFHGYGAGHGVGLCQLGAARMGELGKRYDEILRFYYPGTALGLTARGLAWQALGGERVQLLTTQPQSDGFLIGAAERWMRELEGETGWKFRAQPQLRNYPSVAVFRDATGEPGWVAASTRGRVIRMQPLATLRAAGTLEDTLRHELLHLLVEGRAHPGLPRWFREGVVLALQSARSAGAGSAEPSDPAMLDRLLLTAKKQEETRRAYQLAQTQVELLMTKFGKAQVLVWVERGLPADLLVRLREGR